MSEGNFEPLATLRVPTVAEAPSAATTVGQSIHTIWEAIRDLLNVAGYVLLAFLIIYTLRKPDSVKVYLHNLGLNQVKAGGVELGFDLTQSANALATVSTKVEDLESKIQTAGTSVSSSDAKAKLDSAALQAAALRQDITKANDDLRNAVATQTQKAQSANSGTSLVGWMYLGRTDEAGTGWDKATGTSQMAISTSVSPKLNPGDNITLDSAAYIRGDGGGYGFTTHPIIGAVPGGATVQILELKPNNIVGSKEKFLWAKVNFTP